MKRGELNSLRRENEMMRDALEYMRDPGYNFDEQYRDAARDVLDKIDLQRDQDDKQHQADISDAKLEMACQRAAKKIKE